MINEISNLERGLRGDAETTATHNLESLKVSTEGYLVDSIGDITFDSLIERYLSTTENKEESRLRKIVPEETLTSLLKRYAEGERNLSISLHEISEPYINVVVRGYLDKIFENSTNEEKRELASQKNHTFGELMWESGDFLHATSLEVLPKILAHGNLAGEFLERSHEHGERKSDLSPLFMDSVRLTAFTKENMVKQFGIPPGSISARVPKNKRVFLLYHRASSDWEKDKDISGKKEGENEDALHALMFVGMPSTEIAAVVVNNESSVAKTTKILEMSKEKGLYTPGFLKNGTKFF